MSASTASQDHDRDAQDHPHAGQGEDDPEEGGRGAPAGRDLDHGLGPDDPGDHALRVELGSFLRHQLARHRVHLEHLETIQTAIRALGIDCWISFATIPSHPVW